MRKSFVALLLLAGVAVSANLAFSDEFSAEGQKLTNPSMIKELASRAQKLRTSASPDTVYVGYTPGKFNASTNWWSVGAGSGAGFHRPPAQGGMWDFDSAILNQPGARDSLQGWWPHRDLYVSTGGQTRTDQNRAWFLLDYGNDANYVINSGPAGPTGQKRTYGVVGVWHVDGGSTVVAPGIPAPTWAPLGGLKSAWMGLRAHGDNTHSDPLTNNSFNENVLNFLNQDAAGLTGLDTGFPGYGTQMDQMLYRDIDMSTNMGSDLTVSFQYRTNMSTGIGNVASSRTGWFDKDPTAQVGDLALNPQLNNFISSSAAGDLTAPRDSFMVYVGAPVTGATFAATNGSTMNVMDPLRRWFSEVLKMDGWNGVTGVGGIYKEILSVAGNNAVGITPITVTNADLSAGGASSILGASGGKVRLVFRVKTNRGFDDMGTAYTSGGAGAAVIDDVSYTISGGGTPSAANWGTFEGTEAGNPGDIRNQSGVDALNTWKSTGKPPAIYFHPHALQGAGLAYEDLCGQPGIAGRTCDMIGTIVSAGDHDNGEAAGGLLAGTTERELMTSMMSPTIQLVGPYPVGGNPIGLTSAAQATAGEDYYIDFELYSGIFDPPTHGAYWRYFFMAYPANSKTQIGAPAVHSAWGSKRTPPYIIFTGPDKLCFRDFVDHPVKALSILKTSNASGLPDSVRIGVQKWQRCFVPGVTTGCSPTDGAYWDNISLTIIDGEPAALGAQFWDLLADTFPANDNNALPGTAEFDTTTAYIKSGLNTSPQSGALRIDVPGDSTAVTGGDPTNVGVRVDLVFRIMPGPGNYVTNNAVTSRLRKLPTAATEVANLPGVASTNFWESYLASNGVAGTPGGHPTNGLGKKIWNPNVWNSGRCDTSEANTFAFQGRGLLGGPGDAGIWMGTYHEAELLIRTGLGLSRHKCFVATPSEAINKTDCVNTPPFVGGGIDLTWVTAAGSSWDGTSFTTEGTKILPDGYFTPGTQVQYFFRKSDAASATTVFGIMPDTNSVFPQSLEASTDGHRWQAFSVLPDRWKETGYVNPNGLVGLGKACLLVVDQNDRRGNERVWVGIADTLGATRSNKYGSHNGWHAAGGQDINDPAQFVSNHNGQAGTTWDFYQVRAPESLTTSSGSIGSRISQSAAALGDAQLAGKESRQGPTPKMLEKYYTMMFMFSGDLNLSVLGPFDQRSQDDVGVISNWLTGGSTSAPGNRAFWGMGDGFVESNDAEGIGSPQAIFNADILGVALRENSYTVSSSNSEVVPDLISSSSITTAGGGPCPYPSGCNFVGRNWGVRNQCTWTNDVLEADPVSLVAADMAPGNKYEDRPGSPYQSGMLKSFSTLHPWVALVDGYDLENLTGINDISSGGRTEYFAAALANVFGQVCGIAGTPVISLDVPNSGGIREFGFALRGNPMMSRSATIALSMPRADRVTAKVFDVGGRLVKTLSDGQAFPAGERLLTWDGTDDGGKQVNRGVYFTQVSYLNSKVKLASKLTVLR